MHSKIKINARCMLFKLIYTYCIIIWNFEMRNIESKCRPGVKVKKSFILFCKFSFLINLNESEFFFQLFQTVFLITFDLVHDEINHYSTQSDNIHSCSIFVLFKKTVFGVEICFVFVNNFEQFSRQFYCLIK